MTVVGGYLFDDESFVVSKLDRRFGVAGSGNLRLSRRSLLLLAGGSVMVGGCGTTASLRIQECAVGIEAGFVEFPVWRRSAEEPLLHANRFSGRLAEKGTSREILIRGGVENGRDSIDVYAIRLQPPFVVGAASVKEWESAVAGTLPGEQYVPRNHGSAPTLEFLGRTYQRQGQLWRETVASPGSRWLVIYSHDDGDWTPSGEGRGPFVGGTPRTGAAYFEIFDTSTGKRVFLARTRWSDELTLGAVEWLGDQYLLITVEARSPFHQKCLFVAFP